MSLLRQLIADERGSAAAAIALSVIGLIIGATVVTAAVGLANTTRVNIEHAAQSSAVAQRTSDYYSVLTAGTASPDTAPVCYPDEKYCVAVTSVTDSTDTRTIELSGTAQSAPADILFTQKRTVALPAAGHITGFDSDGAPVWK